jgi:hypothetical protein
MPDKKIIVRIGRDEALILFELLADFSSQSELTIGDEADRLALFRLHGALDSTLVEPLKQDYAQIIEESRKRLIAQSKPSQL